MNTGVMRARLQRGSEQALAKLLASRHAGTRVVILGYHSVHPSASYASASPAQFAEHLDWLVDHCDVVDLGAARVAAPTTRRPRVVITFDDGFADNFTHAFPLLAARALPATFFVTAGFVERDPAVTARMARLWNVAPGDIEPLAWSQAREMADAGMRFGSHTWSHPNLAELTAGAAATELRVSKECIEERLGRPVEDLAYPFGRTHRHLTGETIDLARAQHYRRALAITPRAIRARDDDLCLPRLVIGDDDVAHLAHKVMGGIDMHAALYERFPSTAVRLSARGRGHRDSLPLPGPIETGDPLVSAIITSYNYARFLPTAIESVLGQTYSNLEIVVVDDGSTDDTARVAAGYAHRGVRYVHQPNRGAGQARNAGLAATCGSLVAFLDADDAWLPEKVTAQVTHLGEHPDIALVSCHAYGCDPELRVVDIVWAGKTPAGRIHEQLVVRNCVLNPTCVIVRRGALDRIGGFSEIRPWDDWDTWLRLAKLFPIGFTDSALVKVRRHDNGLSPRTGPERLAFDEAMLQRHITAIPAWKRPIIRRRARSIACLQAGRTAHEQGDRQVARRLSRRALTSDPTSLALRKLAFFVRAHQPRNGSPGSGPREGFAR